MCRSTLCRAFFNAIPHLCVLEKLRVGMFFAEISIARNDIIRGIELKITFKVSFIESEDVNIILVKKERYFHLLISAVTYVDVCQV